MIGLGTASIGRPKYINIKTKLSEEPFNKTRFIQKGKSMLTEAYKQGIRHFDTAPGYGIAESILLEWISEYQPKAITISTKWGYTYVANFEPNAKVHEIKEHSLSKLNEQWEVSKQLLPYLNMYQIHSATLDSGVLENKEVLERLNQLKQEYNLKIGLSTSGDNQNEIIQKALAIKIDNKALFDSFQVTFNVFEQNLLKISRLLKQENKTIILKEALANGRIFPNSNFSQYKNTYNALKAISKKYGTSIDSVALRFCLDSVKPYSVLSGVTEKDHLTSNLLTRNFNLTENEINQIKNLAINPYYYWNERKQMPWV
jgi:aryl-alcohol dehydrogenase-like predicted oxidoreductase